MLLNITCTTLDHRFFSLSLRILYNFSIRTKEISSAFENPDNPTEPDSRLKSIYDVMQKFLDEHVREKAEVSTI